jgi:hypothetical protein
LIKKTEIFCGTSLKLFLRPSLYHPSLTGVITDSTGSKSNRADLDFSKTRVEIPDEASWLAAIADELCSTGARRKHHARFILAKLHSSDKELIVEGLHGLWELCIKRTFHAEVSQGVKLRLPQLC